MRTKINLILGALIALFSGCKTQQKAVQQEIMTLYGVPYATYDVSGKVINEDKQPLAGLQVQVKGYDNHPIHQSVMTDEKGQFHIVQSDFPVDTINIVVSDPKQAYASDSVQHVVELKKKEKKTGFYCGDCEVNTKIVLKKN